MNVQKLQILIVEDDEDTARTMAVLLERAGHGVRIAADGPSALHDAEASEPDVVLLDVGLPGMDGHEVSARLRARKGKPPLIVAITGYGDDAAVRRSAQSGIDLHIVKPVDPARLQQLLNRFHQVVAEPIEA